MPRLSRDLPKENKNVVVPLKIHEVDTDFEQNERTNLIEVFQEGG